MTPTRRPRWEIGGLAAVLALAAWVRLARLPEVLHDGLVLPLGGDSAYHLRRMWLTLERFPVVPVRDPFINWPEGGDCPWGPGWDLAGAALALLAGGRGDPQLAAAVAAALPCLVGVATVAVVVAIGRRLAGTWVGLGSGLMAALMPIAVSVGRYGRADHHVAEVFAMAALGWWALRALPPRQAALSRTLDELLGALIVFAATQVFSGSVLYVAIAGAMVLGQELLTERESWRGGPALLVAGLAGFFPALGIVAQHGEALTYRYPSFLQPGLVVVTGLGCLFVSVACRLSRGPVTSGRLARRLAIVIGQLSILATLTALLVPSAIPGVQTGLTNFLGGQDSWLAGIDEFQPLLRDDAAGRVTTFLGPSALLAPAALLVGLVFLWRRDLRSALIFGGWTLVAGVLALAQVRGVRPFTINLAILYAVTAHVAAGALIAVAVRLGTRSLPRGPLAFSLLGLLALLDPEWRAVLPPHQARELSPIENAGFWLRDHSVPDRGVVAPWDYGHYLLWYAQRPVVTTGFGTFPDADSFAQQARIWPGGEEALHEWMEDRRLGWFVAGAYAYLGRLQAPDGAGPFQLEDSGRPVITPHYYERFPLAASILAGSGSPTSNIRHLEGLWPRFADPTPVTGMPSIPSLIVFERVPGAEIVGQASPEALVEARLSLSIPQGTLPWSAWTHADAQGDFRLRVPIPTGVVGPDIQTSPVLLLRSGGSVHSLTISEQDVREGHTIALAPAPEP